MDPLKEYQLNLTRRHFLRSTGRVSLGVPALMSLFGFADVGNAASLAARSRLALRPRDARPEAHQRRGKERPARQHDSQQQTGGNDPREK